MSYILDALRRAQSERERGSVPGLHSQNLAHSEPQEPSGSRTWLVWLGALMLIAAAAWLMLRDESAPPQPSQAIKPQPPSATPAPDAVVSQTAPDGQRQGQSAPIQAPLLSPPNAPKLSVATATPRPQAASAPAPDSNAPSKPTPPTNAVPPAKPAAVASATVGNTTAALPEGVPANLRDQLPALNITGAVYAQDPAQRLLLVNNVLMRQGDKVRADLTLERIELKSAVFNHQGTRFRLSY